MGIVIIYVYIVVGGHMLCICSCFNDADHMCVKQLPCEKKNSVELKTRPEFLQVSIGSPKPKEKQIRPVLKERPLYGHVFSNRAGIMGSTPPVACLQAVVAFGDFPDMFADWCGESRASGACLW